MIDHDKKSKLIEFLLQRFKGALEDSQKALAYSIPVPDDDETPPEEKELMDRYQESRPVPESLPTNITPQICALLLCTGNIIGGVAFNPISHENEDAENAVHIAFKTLETLPGLTEEFQILAVAMNTTVDQISGELAEIDLALYKKSLSQLPNLTAPQLILVDPVTAKTAPSAHFLF